MWMYILTLLLPLIIRPITNQMVKGGGQVKSGNFLDLCFALWTHLICASRRPGD